MGLRLLVWDRPEQWDASRDVYTDGDDGWRSHVRWLWGVALQPLLSLHWQCHLVLAELWSSMRSVALSNHLKRHKKKSKTHKLTRWHQIKTKPINIGKKKKSEQNHNTSPQEPTSID